MAIILIILILAGCLGLGQFFLKQLRLVFDTSLEELIFSAAVGLGLLAYLVFILGSFGWLYKNIFFFLIAAFFILFLRGCLQCFAKACGELSQDIAGSSRATKFLLLLFLLVAGCALAGTLAPAVGQDELCYHLNHPKYYVERHTIYEIQFATNSLWPYLMEMLYTLGILLQGDALAKLFHFSTYLLASFSVYAFLKRYSESRVAWFGFFVYALTPVAFIQSSYAYIENALTLYIFLSFYSLFVFFERREVKWVVLAGVLTGFAISTKLVGLFTLPVAVFLFLYFYIAQKTGKKRILPLFLFLAAVILCGGAWYVRAYVLRGNPLFPFYPQFFGGHGWQDPSYTGVHGRSRGIISFIIFIWDTTIHPQWYGGEHIGLFYLIFLPFFFTLRTLPGYVKFMTAAAFGYCVLWHVTDPNIRFLLPALALLCPATAISIDCLSKGLSQSFNRSVVGLFFFICLYQSSFAAYHSVNALSLLIRGDKAVYLSQYEPSYFAAQSINLYLTGTDKILSIGEVRGYYFNADLVVDSDFERFIKLGQRSYSRAITIDYLKKIGFTHIMTREERGSATAKDNESFVRQPMLGLNKNDQFLKQEVVVRCPDARYVLYKIL